MCSRRRDFLANLLGVDLDWRMHQLSDGQRRRVQVRARADATETRAARHDTLCPPQIMLQMLRPAEVVLLDEITTGEGAGWEGAALLEQCACAW